MFSFRERRIFFTAFFVAITFAGSQGVQAQSVQACALAVNAPYKSADSRAVYYVSADCKKRPIRNADVYFSHFASWADVRVVAKATLESIPNHPLSFLPWGPRKTFASGSLIKTVNDPRIFLVIGDAVYHITTTQAFVDLGYQGNWVEDVDVSVMARYARQEKIEDTAQLPSGLVFKYVASPTVYRLEHTGAGAEVKRHLETLAEVGREFRIDRIAVLPVQLSFGDATGSVAQTPVMPPQSSGNSSPAASNSNPTTAGISDATRIVSRSTIPLIALGQWFTDPAFGIRLRRMTDKVNSGGFGTQIYSQLQAFSSDNQYILLIENEGYVVRRLDTLSAVSVDLPDVNAPRWQPAVANTIVSYDTNADAVVRVLYSTVNSAAPAQTVFTFPSTYERIRGNQSNDELSHDGRWMTGMAAQASGDQMIFSFDLQNRRLGAQISLNGLYNSACARDPQYGAVEPDWIAASPSGQYLVIQWTRDGATRCSGLETFNMQTGAFVGHVHTGHQHGDLGTDAQGDFFMTFETENTPNGAPYIGLRRLPGPNTGVAARQLLLQMDWSQSGAHISCQGIAPFCSVVADGSPAQAMGGEIFLQYTDGRVLRLTHHRSTACGYWVQPRATVSRDAKYVAFASDWGTARCAASNNDLGRGEAYLIELPNSVITDH